MYKQKRACTGTTICLLSLFFTNSSLAKTSILICNMPSPIMAEPEIVTPTLTGDQKNPELKRAWVEIAVEGPEISDNGGRENNYIKKKIEGLSLDSNSRNIIYQASGKTTPITCATFKKGGTFSRDSFQ